MNLLMAQARSDPRTVDAIAARLRRTREALALRPSEFADRARIARNTYSQWESAKGRPRIDEAMQLCDTYGVTLDWIYLGDPSGLPHRLAQALAGAAA